MKVNSGTRVTWWTQSIFHKESQRTLWQMRWAVSVDVRPGIHLSSLHQLQLNCSLNWRTASRSYRTHINTQPGIKIQQRAKREESTALNSTAHNSHLDNRLAALQNRRSRVCVLLCVCSEQREVAWGAEINLAGLRSCEGHHYQPATSTALSTVTCREIQ